MFIQLEKNHPSLFIPKFKIVLIGKKKRNQKSCNSYPSETEDKLLLVDPNPYLTLSVFISGRSVGRQRAITGPYSRSCSSNC